MIALANELGYDVVAEGVEEVDQLEALREFGCSRAQGYLFGRPAPFADVFRRLTSEDNSSRDAHV